MDTPERSNIFLSAARALRTKWPWPARQNEIESSGIADQRLERVLQ
jgi:hypothetical protein